MSGAPLIVRISMLPTIIYGAGMINGFAVNQNRKLDTKYKYGFLSIATMFNIGNTLPATGLITLGAFGTGVAAATFGTGAVYCMGHMTARMLKDFDGMQ